MISLISTILLLAYSTSDTQRQAPFLDTDTRPPVESVQNAASRPRPPHSSWRGFLQRPAPEQSEPLPRARTIQIVGPTDENRRDSRFSRRVQVIKERMRNLRLYAEKKKLLIIIPTVQLIACIIMAMIETIFHIHNTYVIQGGTWSISASMSGAMSEAIALLFILVNAPIYAWVAFREYYMIQELGSDSILQLSCTKNVSWYSQLLSIPFFVFLTIFNTKDFPISHGILAAFYFVFTWIAALAQLRVRSALKREGLLRYPHKMAILLFSLMTIGFIGCLLPLDSPHAWTFSVFEYLFALSAILNAGCTSKMYEEATLRDSVANIIVQQNPQTAEMNLAEASLENTAEP